ncbi:aldehyde dehydrogenase (NAD(P)(+)) ald5 [Chytriomyces hyalinus]|nr:aldehyde dehydrogenase (NAD(P)(+)) ald5 [Chytriomyces hyalinus]
MKPLRSLLAQPVRASRTAQPLRFLVKSTHAYSTTAKVDGITLRHPSGRVFENVPTGLFINNEFVASKSGKTFETYDPNNGKPIASVFEAGADDVNAAVEAAKKAFITWSKFSPAKRGDVMYKLATLIKRDQAELGALEAYDNGKPVGQATNVDLSLVIEHFKYFAGFADKMDNGRGINVGEGIHAYTRVEPYGVVGQITPWNFPLLMVAWKIAPALAAGNVCVLKTSEKTPLSALKLCQLIVEAGFPPGVVNILSGFGPTAGDAIARHMDIHKLSFTGSTATGRKIMAAAAESNLKKVSLELGGKSPNIVFDDANLDDAIASARAGYVFNQGQVCCAGTRLFVQEGIYNEFMTRLKADAADVKVGHTFKNGTDMGPLVDKLQFEKVMGFFEQGKKEGAIVEFGGERVGTEGYYVKPTIFSNVKTDMKIVKEEIFGPVVVVDKFKTIEEAIKKANNSEYGLAASIHTTNISTYIKVANALQAGTVWVNTHNEFNAAVPFGGYKSSGIGRDGGAEAIKEYTQVKAVFVRV